MSRRSILVFVGLLAAGTSVSGLEIPDKSMRDRVHAIATAAREKYPTSPTDAATAFITEFNGTFGNIEPTDLRVVDTKDLSVKITTPIALLRNHYFDRLRKLEAIDPAPEHMFVLLEVFPMTRSAPNVSRVAMFRGATEIRPIEDALGLREFSTAIGNPITIHSGHLRYPLAAFDKGAGPMKILLLAASGPIEWTMTEEDISRTR